MPRTGGGHNNGSYGGNDAMATSVSSRALIAKLFVWIGAGLATLIAIGAASVGVIALVATRKTPPSEPSTVCADCIAVTDTSGIAHTVGIVVIVVSVVLLAASIVACTGACMHSPIISYVATGLLALGACAIGGGGGFLIYLASSKQAQFDAISLDQWKAASDLERDFIQYAFSCCGLIVDANGNLPGAYTDVPLIEGEAFNACGGSVTTLPTCQTAVHSFFQSAIIGIVSAVAATGLIFLLTAVATAVAGSFIRGELEAESAVAYKPPSYSDDMRSIPYPGGGNERSGDMYNAYPQATSFALAGRGTNKSPSYASPNTPPVTTFMPKQNLNKSNYGVAPYNPAKNEDEVPHLPTRQNGTASSSALFGEAYEREVAINNFHSRTRDRDATAPRRNAAGF